MISEETVSRIREANDVVEVIGESVQLKRAGKDFKGLCPFHQEKTPSFLVSPSKAIFHCFGCGVGGDVFKFVMEADRCSYPEAIRKLGERKGIPIEQERNPGEFNAKFEKKKRLFEILDRSAQFYHKNFLESKEAEAAREYIAEKRKLTSETIDKFQIGWAPQGPDALYKNALKAGFAEADLLAAGVAIRSQKDGKVRDVFRNRVLFPIWDLKGQVIGFGGRILEGGKFFGSHPPPKYLNSADSDVFQKGKNLYGFYQASKAIREKDEVLLLEGYMDVIACWQAGIENAAAPLGTSLTQDQCQILKRYASQVTVLFDMDRAGEMAGMRGAELLLEFGFFPMMASLPDAKDADEFLKKHGKEDFENVLKKKSTLTDFKIEALMREKADLPPEIQRVAAAKAALPLLLKVKDEITRSEMLRRISLKTGIMIESLTAEWQRLSSSKGFGGLKETEKKPKKPFLTSEEELLCLAVQHFNLRKPLVEAREKFDLFKTAALTECFEAIRKNPELADLNQVLGAVGEGSARDLRAMMIRFEETTVSNPDEVFESILKRLNQKKEEERLKSLSGETAKFLHRGGTITDDAVEFQKLAPTVKGRKE